MSRAQSRLMVLDEMRLEALLKRAVAEVLADVTSSRTHVTGGIHICDREDHRCQDHARQNAECRTKILQRQGIGSLPRSDPTRSRTIKSGDRAGKSESARKPLTFATLPQALAAKKKTEAEWAQLDTFTIEEAIERFGSYLTTRARKRWSQKSWPNRQRWLRQFFPDATSMPLAAVDPRYCKARCAAIPEIKSQLRGHEKENIGENSQLCIYQAACTFLAWCAGSAELLPVH